MKRIACIAAAAFLLITGLQTQAQNNTLNDAEKKDGWQLLFDGTTLNGWHTYGKKDTVQPKWMVQDGSIHMDSSMKQYKGDLVTKDEFGNFDLKLEWKIAPKGNSGIIFFVKEDPKYKESYFTGLEMQVLDNEGHSDGKLFRHRAGNLYDLIAGCAEPVKPVGEWNQVEIIADHGKLELFLNGVNVVSTTLWNDEWKKMVAGSKFKQWPDFGTYTSGKIALQDHDCDVWYRNIKIKKLKYRSGAAIRWPFYFHTFFKKKPHGKIPVFRIYYRVSRIHTGNAADERFNKQKQSKTKDTDLFKTKRLSSCQHPGRDCRH